MTPSELSQLVDSLHDSSAPPVLRKREEKLQTSLQNIETRPDALLLTRNSDHLTTFPITLQTHPDGYVVLEHADVNVLSIFRAVATGC